MINYKLQERVNPQDVAAPNKFYAVKQAQETLTLRDFARRISRESTISSMDCMAVIEGLFQIIPDEIANGKIIKLGEFGTFRSTLSSEGVDNEADFNLSKIKKLNVRFRPTNAFKVILTGVEFKRLP